MSDDYPLSGIRVADFGQLIAIPGATQQLAELGADVIKIEPPQGEPARTMAGYGEAILRGFNRGKRSIVLDLKDRRGLEIAQRIITNSDVFCHNLRPGTMERLGLGAAKVRALNPRIINVAVSGFGPHGPSATRAGLDIAAQAESGLMSMTGEAGREPQRVGLTVVDQTTAYQVTQAILAALYRRERTGRGDDIRVALLDSAIHLQTINWMEQSATGVPLRRKGNGQQNAAPAADVISVADGQFILTAYSESHFLRLCDLIGREDIPGDPRFADNSARVQNRDALLEIISSAFAGRTVAACIQSLIDIGLVAAAIRSYEEVAIAPDVTENAVFATATASDGTRYEVPVPPARSTLYDPAVVGGRVPKLGEHTDEVLAEFGFAPASRDSSVPR